LYLIVGKTFKMRFVYITFGLVKTIIITANKQPRYKQKLIILH